MERPFTAEARRGRGSTYAESGFNVLVSDARLDDLRGQIKDALAFLARHEAEIRRLIASTGVGGVCLDFGLQQRDAAAQTDVFPPELVRHAAALDLGLTMTHYAVKEEEVDAP